MSLSFLRNVVLCLFASCVGYATAAEPSSKNDVQTAFFEAKIRPILVEHCYRCHSAESGKSESGLRSRFAQTIRQGGDRGSAVVPGDPDASILLSAISHADSDLKMPPKMDRLPESVIDDFRTWIQDGAIDPREKSAGGLPPVSIAAGRQFWAYQKPISHQPPATNDPTWARRDLDHFILAKLEAAGLKPSADAEPATLVRRLHFDLVGLPPAPAALERFLQAIERDGIDSALAAEVDELLASPQFGEALGPALARRGAIRRVER